MPDNQTTPRFALWCAELDRIAHEKYGSPYGLGSTVANTGANSWIGYFEDGYSPDDALAEDQSYD